MVLTWAFRDERVETASNPHADAIRLYCNVMALPTVEAATIVTHARAGMTPEDPIQLVHWTRGLSLLCDMLQQPMGELDMFRRDRDADAQAPEASAA